MKYHILALLFLFISVSSFSQQQHFGVTFSPLALIDVNTPSIQPGVFYAIRNRWEVGLEYGQRFRALESLHRNDQKMGNRYFRLKSEVRYFFKNSISLLLYVGAEGFMIPQRYRLSNDYYWSQGNWNSFDSSGIRRTITGYAIKGGQRFFIDKKEKFLVDISAGIGEKWVSVRHQDTKGLQVNVSRPIDEFSLGGIGDKFDGVQKAIHIAFNIKLGYIIR